MIIKDLQDLNSKTLAELETAVTRVNELLNDPNLDLDDESRLLARRGLLFDQITIQSVAQAHLKASKIAVAFSPKEEADLTDLEAKMDGFILAGAKIGAVISLVPKIVDTASDIEMKMRAHTAKA